MIADLEQFSHGLTIKVVSSSKSYHTFRNWNLMQRCEMDVQPPEPKTHVIDDIVGIDGVIDITERYGEIKFKNRTVKYKFDSLDCDHSCWMDILRKINNSVHGRICEIYPDIDPMYYWKGRVYIETESKADGFVGTLVVKIDAEPRMYKIGTKTGGVL